MTRKIPDPEKARDYFESANDFALGPTDLESMIDQGEEVNIVDVRAAEDYVQGHVPSAVSLPQEQWGDLENLRKDRVNVVYSYSQVCHLAKKAALEFSSKGYPVMELEGGWKAWFELRFEIEKGVMQPQKSWQQASL